MTTPRSVTTYTGPILDKLLHFLTPERLEAIIRRHRVRQQRWQQKTQTGLSALERELVRVERELAILWERHVDGTLGLDQYRHLNTPLWAKKEQLAAQIAAAKAPIEVDFQVDREVLEKAIKETVQWLGAGDLAKRRTILGKLFTEIRIGPRGAGVRTTSREVWILSDIEGLTPVFVASPRGGTQSPCIPRGLYRRKLVLNAGRLLPGWRKRA